MSVCVPAPTTEFLTQPRANFVFHLNKYRSVDEEEGEKARIPLGHTCTRERAQNPTPECPALRFLPPPQAAPPISDRAKAHGRRAEGRDQSPVEPPWNFAQACGAPRGYQGLVSRLSSLGVSSFITLPAAGQCLHRVACLDLTLLCCVCDWGRTGSCGEGGLGAVLCVSLPRLSGKSAQSCATQRECYVMACLRRRS